MKLHWISAEPPRRLADLAQRCRQRGLAVTPQRLAFIKALLLSEEHPRAEAIYPQVRKGHPHISLATIHRTLETLCEIGEARKVTQLHDSARHEGNVMPHHHAVWIKCRRIRDLEIATIDRLLAGRSGLRGFNLLGSSLEIQALCDRAIRSGSREANGRSADRSHTWFQQQFRQERIKRSLQKAGNGKS